MFEYIDFQRREGTHCKDDIKLFGLSTCAFCKRAINFLEENEIKYDLVFMDEIDPYLKSRAKREFRIKFNPTSGFNSPMLASYKINSFQFIPRELAPRLLIVISRGWS